MKPSEEAQQRLHEVFVGMEISPNDMDFANRVTEALVADPDALLKLHVSQSYCSIIMLSEALRLKSIGWQDWMTCLPGMSIALRESADTLDRLLQERGN